MKFTANEIRVLREVFEAYLHGEVLEQDMTRVDNSIAARSKLGECLGDDAASAFCSDHLKLAYKRIKPVHILVDVGAHQGIIRDMNDYILRERTTADLGLMMSSWFHADQEALRHKLDDLLVDEDVQLDFQLQKRKESISERCKEIIERRLSRDDGKQDEDYTFEARCSTLRNCIPAMVSREGDHIRAVFEAFAGGQLVDPQKRNIDKRVLALFEMSKSLGLECTQAIAYRYLKALIGEDIDTVMSVFESYWSDNSSLWSPTSHILLPSDMNRLEMFAGKTVDLQNVFDFGQLLALRCIALADKQLGHTNRFALVVRISNRCKDLYLERRTQLDERRSMITPSTTLRKKPRFSLCCL